MQLKLTRDLENLSPNLSESTSQIAAEKIDQRTLSQNTVPLTTVAPKEAENSRKHKELNSKENREIVTKEQQVMKQSTGEEVTQVKPQVAMGENQQKWSNLFAGNKMAAR
ncbi:hypothetical protein A4A49_62003, partial [Nicotiana attenuata]